MSAATAPGTVERAIAIVGVGAVLPDAPNVDAFWNNLTGGRYSISDVDPTRWNPDFYYDPDRQATDKTYSKIGGWVRDWDWSPLEWRLPIPPKVAGAMDRTQQWAVSAARQALADYGHPDKPLDHDRTAVVLGNAMGGDLHYLTALSVYFPEYADELQKSPSFAALPPDVQTTIVDEMRTGMQGRFPDITEDTMPGELANIIAGRLANLFDFHGPNFIVDAACASAMAAIDAAVEGLEEGAYDAVLTGGVDANMSASTFVKFCKIGALSATGTRPFGEGADGFVMGEGAALFLLKRLADAEAAGDHIYAVLRGIGGASDGKGKGITAPNPVGQRLAVTRAWRNAGTAPDTATMIEAHGTSTKVGDVVESQSIADAFGDFDLPVGSLALGSVKSNIGHLKGAAGAAGMLKAALSLDRRVLPPSLNATTPNPNIDFGSSPLRVNTELRDWDANGHLRTAGVSAFGFGGTNFHMVLEEHVPGRLTAQRSTFAVGAEVPSTAAPAATAPASADLKAPMRGLAVVGGTSSADVVGKLATIRDAAADGSAPSPAPPADADLRAAVRVAIDFADAADLASKATKAISALENNNAAAWKLLRNQGVFHGEGPAHQLAMLYTGQGSQYVNMLAELRATEPIVGAIFDEADRIMEPLIGRPLTEIIFVDPDNEVAVAEANQQLMQTEITQPAVLTVDLALTRLFEAYGIEPDMVMGHSLGEYGALVAAGALPFADALEAVSARGREMASVSVDDNGLMAAVFAPMDTIEETIAAVDDYVVVANINSGSQAVIGGSTPGVEAAAARLVDDGHQVVMLPVSHAFHTSIVAPAADPLGDVLRRLDVQPPTVPTVANVNGEFYPMGPAVVPDMIEILRQQIASPVQFIKGLETLHDAGARVFVEVGPKRALHGFVDEVLAGDDSTVLPLFANHPKTGDIVSFNQALAGLYASGHGVGTGRSRATAGAAISGAAPGALAQTPAPVTPGAASQTPTPAAATRGAAPPTPPPAAATRGAAPASPAPAAATGGGTDRYMELGRLFADVLERGYEVLGGAAPSAMPASRGDGVVTGEPVVVTGAALGLPGTDHVFDDGNLARLLDGESFIDAIPVGRRQAIVDKKITRLVKNESGGGSWEVIESQHDVVKLAGQRGELDLVEDFGMSAERVAALDSSSELAIGAGIDALRDAGIPLTMHYKATTTGGTLPDRWGLPDSMRDDTGIIFASAFPGLDNMTREVTAYQRDLSRRERLADLQHLRDRISDDDPAMPELEHMIQKVSAEMDAEPYEFNRRFLFRILSMGHSQFAEHIGARGPNTQVNAACASTTQAVSLAEDWIRLGRCRRVLIISGDEATNESLMEWIGAGFLASGAAATDEVVEEAALPFDKRRHGMLIGMGAAAIVVERADAARERGIRPIADVLGGVTANSAFHGSRLDVDHICQVMEGLVADVERRWGVSRSEIARNGVFVSHETYTPARGGSAQAEVNALRTVFGADADRLVVANTKGFTGHAMGVGVEDVLAVKALETGIVPPIANVKEIDPDLGHLNLSKGGAYPVRYALRLGAGFGSQISMSLMRWTPPADGRHREPAELGFGYRIDDPAAWQRFLEESSGYDEPELEVVSRALRVRDDGPPAKRPVRAEKPVAKAPEVVNAPPIEPLTRAAAGVTTGASAPHPAAAGVDTGGAAPAASVAPAASASTDPVIDQVLEIVAEQTGYPSDMLELDLDLEADLGIDTVKQAETFAAIREHYDIERDDNLSLRDYPTLGHVVGFVRERAVGLPDVAPAAVPTETTGAAAPGPTPAVADEIVDQVLAVVAEQTGYPADML
ncbi:MAG: beta-ketoacyl synthase N-terminal-like domain-containing protein, partial [Actinomycetota bacterium]